MTLAYAAQRKQRCAAKIFPCHVQCLSRVTIWVSRLRSFAVFRQTRLWAWGIWQTSPIYLMDAYPGFHSFLLYQFSNFIYGWLRCLNN